MTDKTMTLLASYLDDGGWHIEADNVRNGVDLESYENETRLIDWITRHLSQPAERGEVGDEKCRRIQENRDYWYGVAEELRKRLWDATNTAPPPAAGVPDAWPKLELWFFRELSSAQRLSLLDLHGFPVDEIGESHVWQKNALRQLLYATPSPTIDVAAVREVIAECRRPMPRVSGKGDYYEGYDEAMSDVADQLEKIIGDAK